MTTSKSLLAFFIAIVPLHVALGDNKFDTKIIEALTGLKGSWNETEGVFKLTNPRTDIPISVDQWKMPAFMGLSSWAAFKKGPEAFMVMGDLVLFEDEVNPVLGELLNNGLKVTALHNHFFYDQPRVYFMHIAGDTKLEVLARGVGKAFAKVRSIRDAQPNLAASFSSSMIPAKSAINDKAIEAILGKGQAQDGMFKVVFGREVTMECGCKATRELGVNTWAAFAGTDDNAVVDGDFAVLESELQAVLKSLHSSGINIVAIHHHMTGERPRMLFLHYWGRGKAIKLAKAVKDALQFTK